MEKEQKKEKLGKGTKSSGRASGAQTPTGTAAATGERKRVQAENGKILIVDSIGNVYLEEQDEDGMTQEFLLDIDEIPRLTIRDTALYRFPAGYIVRLSVDFRKTRWKILLKTKRSSFLPLRHLMKSRTRGQASRCSRRVVLSKSLMKF